MPSPLPPLIAELVADTSQYETAMTQAAERALDFAATVEAAGAQVDAALAGVGAAGTAAADELEAAFAQADAAATASVARVDALAASYAELGAAAEAGVAQALAAEERLAAGGSAVVAENERNAASFAQEGAAATTMGEEVAAAQAHAAAAGAATIAENERTTASFTEEGAAATRAGEQATAAGVETKASAAEQAASVASIQREWAALGASVDKTATQTYTGLAGMQARTAQLSADLDAQAARASASADALGAAWATAGDKGASGSARMRAGAADATSATATLGERVSATGQAVSGFADTATAKYGLVGAAVAVAGGASVKMAADFQTATTRLVTSAGESQQNIDMVRRGMLQLGADTGTATKEVESGMYIVESAGYHGADGLNVLKVAMQGAKQEGASVVTVADAVSTALTDYHLPASAAATVTSQLVTAVGQGKTTMGDFAGSLHSVTPLAAAAGISLADVTGTLAEMTAHGMSADQASQNLANAIRALQNPSQVAQKELFEIGLTSQQVQQSLGQNGLSATLNLVSDRIKASMGPGATQVIVQLQQAIDGLDPRVQKLAQAVMDGSMSQAEFSKQAKTLPPVLAGQASSFDTLVKSTHNLGGAQVAGGEILQTYAGALNKAMGGATGLNVALMTTGENAPGVANNISLISGATADAAGNVKGWDEIQNTFNQKVDVGRQSLENLAIAVGTDLIPPVEDIIGPLSEFAQGVAEGDQSAQLLADGVLALGGAVTLVFGVKFLSATVSAARSVASFGTSTIGFLGKIDVQLGQTAARYGLLGQAAQERALEVQAAAAESATAEETAAAEMSAAMQTAATEMVTAVRTGMTEIVAEVRASGIQVSETARVVGTEAGTAEGEAFGAAARASIAAGQAEAEAELAGAGGAALAAEARTEGAAAGTAEGEGFAAAARTSMAEGEVAAAEGLAVGSVGLDAKAAGVGAEAGAAQGTGMAGGIAASEGEVAAAGATAAGAAAVGTKAGWLSKFTRSAGEVGLLLVGADFLMQTAGIPSITDRISGLVDQINHAFTGDALSPSTQAMDAWDGRISNSVREALGLADLYSQDGMSRLDTTVTQGSQQSVQHFGQEMGNLPDAVTPSFDEVGSKASQELGHRLPDIMTQAAGQTVQATQQGLAPLPAVVGPPMNAMVAAVGTADRNLVDAHQQSMDDLHAKSTSTFSALMQSVHDYATNAPPVMTSADSVMRQNHQAAMDDEQAKSRANSSAMVQSVQQYATALHTIQTPAEQKVAADHQEAMDREQATSQRNYSAMEQAAGNYAQALAHTVPPAEAAVRDAHQAAMDAIQAKSDSGFSAAARSAQEYRQAMPPPVNEAGQQAVSYMGQNMDDLHARSQTGFSAVQQSAQQFATQFPATVQHGADGAVAAVGTMPPRFAQAGGDAMSGLAQGITTESPQAAAASQAAGQSVWQSFASILGIASPSRVFNQGGQDMMSGATQGVQQGTPELVTATSMAGQQASQALTQALQPVSAQVGQIFDQAWQQAEIATQQGVAAVDADTTQLGVGVEASVQAMAGQVEQGVTTMWSTVDQEFGQGGQQVVNVTQQTAAGVENGLNQLPGVLQTIGYNAMAGFANGIAAEGQVAVQEAYQIAVQVQQLMAQALQIRSPSKVMEELGEFTMMGFHGGMSGYASSIFDWVGQFAGDLSGSFSSVVDEIEKYANSVGSSSGGSGGASSSGGSICGNCGHPCPPKANNCPSCGAPCNGNKGGSGSGSSGSGSSSAQGPLPPGWDAATKAAFDQVSEYVSEQGGQLNTNDPGIKAILEKALGKQKGDVDDAWLARNGGTITGEQFPVTLTTDTRINNLSAAERGIPAPTAGDLHIHVAGNVIDAEDLFSLVQQQALKNGYRNPTSGLSLSGCGHSHC